MSKGGLLDCKKSPDRFHAFVTVRVALTSKYSYNDERCIHCGCRSLGSLQ